MKLSEPTTQDASLVDVLCRRAGRQADALAYVFLAEGEREVRRVTYGELELEARVVAALLQRHCSRGERALLLYPPGLELIFAFLGCCYAGVVAVPAYPPKANRAQPRLRSILRDAEPQVVLTTSLIVSKLDRLVDHHPELRGIEWVVTDRGDEARPGDFEPVAVGGEDLAFLQYTSGSTASPKGVMVRHANLFHNGNLIQAACGHSSQSTFVSWLPVYHDLGLIGNLLQSLHVGASCVLMPPVAFLQRPLRWLEAVSRYRATTSGGPNFAYDLCARHVPEEAKAKLDLSCWQVAFNGAEPVQSGTLERFAEAFSVCGFRKEAFYPCYGLAEATLMVSGGDRRQAPVVERFNAAALEKNEVRVDPESGRSLVGSGRILGEQNVLIVDPQSRHQCPPERLGEIWIHGPSVAGGYRNRPQDTDELFRAVPHGALSDGGEERFLRTGDLGFLHGGELFVTGRLKDLIIIRGRNHYPQDIELTAETSHGAITPGCGVAFSHEVDEAERLVVVYEVRRTRGLDLEEVTRAVRQAVALEHDVQSHEVVLVRTGTVPKTSSGKVRRRLCRSRYLAGELVVLSRSVARSWEEGGPESPADLDAGMLLALEEDERLPAIEGYLLELARHMIGDPAAGTDPERTLAGLGLDSLALVRFAHAVEESLGAVLPLPGLLEGPSLDTIARQCLEQLRETVSTVRGADARGGAGDHPLSYGQQALWFLERLAPESAAYHLAGAVKVGGRLDMALLRRCLRELTARHSALRTTFHGSRKEPIQRVNEQAEIELLEVEAGILDTARLFGGLHEVAYRPFDLERGPLTRVAVWRRSSGEHVLLWVMHHIVSDFWSCAVLLRELGELYTALASGKAPSLAPLPSSFTGWVRRETRRLAGARGQRLESYWRGQLADAPWVLELPTDRLRLPVRTYRGRAQGLRFDASLTGRLRSLARTHRATLFMTLLAAFEVLLYRYSRQKVFLIGSPAAGRRSADLEQLVGYFVNPVVLRADCGGNPTFERFLAAVRQTALRAFEHDDYPFALLVERLHPVRDPNRPPLFQVMFSFQSSALADEPGMAAFALGENGARMRLGPVPLESLALRERRGEFDLNLMIAETEDGLGAALQYNSALFDPSTIARMSGHFLGLLVALSPRGDQGGKTLSDGSRMAIEDLPILRAAQRQQLLVELNATRAGRGGLLIHEEFENQVKLHAGATAAIFKDEEITYDALNRRANRLAHALRELAVGIEEPVGIYMERSLDLLATLLAVLKSGGAFLPLDPSYPRERLGWILGDAEVRVVVSQDRLASDLREFSGHVLCPDRDRAGLSRRDGANPDRVAAPGNLAYLIYTSGSTGRPKGVEVAHENVVNFFTGMDREIACGPRDTLLAVTSISFDISVLELLWTLARGARVVLADDRAASVAPRRRAPAQVRPMEFSLFYFASDSSQTGDDKYRLLLEGTRFADRHGFSAVWTPERHFHAFGGLYPNPAITNAALATVTERVQLRAGSVVLPLHNPIRVAEEWSVIDNLSRGRTGIAFASGWHGDDFVFSPTSYQDRKELMWQGIETVRKLWSGESVEATGGAGNELEVRIFPRPVQPELPIWITAGGSVETFVKAGENGAHVLTHLLGQSVEELADKIRVYRDSRARCGHDPDAGCVSLMLHTFLWGDREEVREKVRGPFSDYLWSSVGLIRNLVRSAGLSVDLDDMSDSDRESLLEYAFDRYFETSALFGDPESCLAMIHRLKELGVDEVACLIDFGIDEDVVLEGLSHLLELRRLEEGSRQAGDESLAVLARRQGATLLQCTPSRMKMLVSEPGAYDSLGSLRALLLGGEALPTALARELRDHLECRLVNVYGPTETTIWSSTWELGAFATSVPIGRPIVNTQIHLLEHNFDAVPLGVPGEVVIGGDGVARGYFRRPGLTATQFVPDPFTARPGQRLYRTGDLSRRDATGVLEFLGRFDHQVKLRGYRIELGEVEAALGEHPEVPEVVVLAREDRPGDQRLVAYVVGDGEGAASEKELRHLVRRKLPEYMVPSDFVFLADLPRTPNGKLDRRALGPPAGSRRGSDAQGPRTATEERVAGIWCELLDVEQVGIHDDFFEVGGHSLLAMLFVSQLRDQLQVEVPLRTFFQAPTVAAVAEQVDTAQRARSAPIPQRSRDASVPLSFAQERLWFIDHFEPGSAAYNNALAIRFEGRLEPSGLAAVLGEIVRRHEALRTRFPLVDDQPLQVIEAPPPADLAVVSLEALPEAARQTAARRLAPEEVRRPFDLEAGPVYRTLLVRFAQDDSLLVLTLHHVVSDGWSLEVLIREVATLLEASAEGRPSPLAEPLIQYADYAAHERRRMEEGAHEDLLAYWKERLAGELPVLELPGDRPRPSVQTYDGALASRALPEGLSQELRQLSRQQGATLFMTLLAVFEVLLHRYTGSRDLLVGTPSANRNRSELEGLIGLFVNTLVLRADLSGDPSFQDLVTRLREVTLSGYSHEEIPFARVVEELQPERDLGHNPLFQVMFVLENALELRQPAGLKLTRQRVDTATSKLDVTLRMVDEGPFLLMELEYRTDLFDTATMARMSGHLERLMEGCVREPGQRLSALPVLTAAERRQLLEEWNDSARHYDRPRLLHVLFEGQVERTPDAVALELDDRQWSYGRFNRWCNRVAHNLVDLGVGCDDVVGVCLDRCLEMVAGLMAILKAGGAYLPLAPSDPPGRRAAMLSDARARVVLTQGKWLASLDAPGVQAVVLDEELRDEDPCREVNPVHDTSRDGLAYVIFTSGSTGRPKGVMIPHSGICNRLFWMQEAYGLGAHDRVLQKTTYTFDVSVWEFFWPLITGARLVVARPGGQGDPAYLAQVIADRGVTTLHFVPSMLKAFLEAEELAAAVSPRRVIVSGEALTPELQDRFFACLSSRLHNLYGPTEASVDVTYWACRRDSDALSVPIGRPIANTQVHLLDTRGRQVPEGVPGELHIGGVGLARGYLGRPALSAEKFVPNTFSRRPGERLYATGDLARWRHGVIEFFGRLDHQVKIRGFRVEPKEVESVLKKHPALQDAVVVSRRDRTGETRLAAYLMVVDPPPPADAELRTFLGDELPDYMVPSAFVTLAELPVTASGKLDQRSLPAPQERRVDARFVAPRLPTEEMLAAVWSQVLGSDQIGIHDNFFQLGGDSIRSIQVRARARKMGLDLAIQDLFRHQTIHELAQVASRAEPGVLTFTSTAPFSLVSDEDRRGLPVGLEDAYPLARLQEGLVFHSEYSPDYEVYVTSYEIRARFDEDALRRALQRFVERHPMMRTSFDLTHFSEALQLVHRKATVPVRVEDLCALASAAQKAFLKDFQQSEKRRKFDWTRAPFLRVWVHLLEDERFQCTLVHPILDGWSMALMSTELFRSYLTLVQGQPLAAEDAPRVQYRDFIALERQELGTDESRQFWTRHLAASTNTLLPRWSPRPVPDRDLHVRKVVEVPGGDLRRLQALARRAAVPLKSVLLAAHLKVVSLFTGQTDVLTGLIANGRPEELDGDRVLGLFLNTLAFRLRLTGGTWFDLARGTFEAERETLAFRRYPLAELMREHGGQPVFETAFNFTHFHVFHSLQGLDGMELLGASVPSDQTYFIQTTYFNLDLTSSHLVFALDFDARELHAQQMEAMAQAYLRVMKAMGSEPLSSSVSRHFLTPGGGHQMLVEWNATQMAAPPAGIHRLFEEHAARTPGATALVWEEQWITYQELDRRSNQLARYLRRQGVRHEDLVAVCLERSPEMLVALLAVLKASGTYLPLNPGDPDERRKFMIGDAGARAVLTREPVAGLAGLPCREISFLRDAGAIASEKDTRLNSVTDPSDLAYVIYTSGSTGRPKAVQVPHGAVVNFLSSMRERPGLGPADRLLAVTTLSFDIAVLELFLPLTVGACTFLASRRTASDGVRLAQALSSSGATVMQATPATWKMLFEAGWSGNDRLKVLCGGEALPAETADRLRAAGGEVWNMYGPTETCIWSSVDKFAGEVRLGRAIANTEIYVVDTHVQPVPRGTPGQLLIGGAGLARGYLRRAALTAEKFIPHPLSRRRGARLYTTGDLVRRTPDGNLEFLGRLDHQVKIRGFRMELGEIETVLARHPGVSQAVVTAPRDKNGEARLAAYLVADDDTRPVTGELRDYLRQHLPDYMVPSFFVVLDELPLTPNRKIDRKALPALEARPPEVRRSSVEPRDTLELQLVDLWEEILEISPVGVRDDFFDLGGHSLLGVRLMARIRERYGRELGVASLFEGAGTIEGLARLLRQDADLGPRSPLVKLRAAESGKPLFCVHPIGGNVLCYVELARHLGQKVPFYALQVPGRGDGHGSLDKIEDMASSYIEAIVDTQPSGPYRLAGWSMGAVVAFEMAQQLRRQGQEVELLALVDASVPGRNGIRDEPAEAALVRWFAVDLAGRSGRKLPPTELPEDLDGEDLLRFLWTMGKEMKILPPDIDVGDVQDLFDVFKANLGALSRYVPQTYPGRVDLFLSEERGATAAADPSLGWGELAQGGFKVSFVPGDHYSLLRAPHVELLAAQLMDRLGQAETVPA